MLPSQVREPVEQVGAEIGEGIGKGISALGQTKPIQELKERTEPGGAFEEGLGIFSGLGEIAGTIAGTGGTVGTLTTTANFAAKQAARVRPNAPGATPPPPHQPGRSASLSTTCESSDLHRSHAARVVGSACHDRDFARKGPDRRHGKGTRKQEYAVAGRDAALASGGVHCLQDVGPIRPIGKQG